MNRWQGKVAVVTGASSGIGAAIVKDLLKAGMKVVGLARRKEKMEEEARKCEPCKGKFYPRKCDVSREQDILEAFAWVKQNLGGVDVLINNAGISRSNTLTAPGNSDDLRSVIEVNVLGLCFCTREAFNSMKERNVAGHIIHINSIAGHFVPHMDIPLNIYPASKHAVTALTETLRREMIAMNNRTKVTSICPGLVSTEILEKAMTPDQVSEFLSKTPYLEAEDISQAVLYALGTPERVQVHDIVIRPIGETM